MSSNYNIFSYFEDEVIVKKMRNISTIPLFCPVCDVAMIKSEDPQFYRFIGRCKDLIIRGGMNIAPAELDNLLSAHEFILDVAVAPYPCEIMGERIAVFVTLKPEKHLSLADIIDYLKQQHVASFKLPEKLVLVAEIPRNPLGKVLRFKLSELSCSGFRKLFASDIKLRRKSL